jgi:hypothetical protein
MVFQSFSNRYSIVHIRLSRLKVHVLVAPVFLLANSGIPAFERLWEMLIQRCPDLRELSIEGTSNHFPIAGDFIIRGRWPHLHKLVLGDVSIDQPATKGPFIEFLEAHLGLETLRLSRHNVKSTQFSSLDPTALPNVTEFTGTLEQLKVLPQIHTSLKSLTLQDSMRAHQSASFAIVEGLKSLTRLRVSFVSHSTYDTISFLRSLVVCSPQLSRLDLNCGRVMSFDLVCAHACHCFTR